MTAVARLALVAVLAIAYSVSAQEPEPAAVSAAKAAEVVAPLPSFAALEAVGATIGEIRIVNKNIFDPDDPKEDKLLFRWANALHIQTRVPVIQRALLFKSGDKVSVNHIEETERVLRATRYLYDVNIRPIAYTDGVVDIEVRTRDTWTLDPAISISRSGGTNSSRVKLIEQNFAGSGASVSYGRSKDVDRSSNEFQFSNERMFGGWTSLSYSRASNSDGRRDAAALARPFYSLDTPWAAGVSASRDNRIERTYNGGVVTGEYRHRTTYAEMYGGLSKGRVDGWVRRYSIGMTEQEDVYALEEGRVAPAVLPPDERTVAPFLRFEVIEDRFVKQQNRNLIDRSEFFALGFASTVQLGWASTSFGSTREALLYSATMSRGFEPFPNHTLLASGTIGGQYTEGLARRQRAGGQAQYFLPQSPRLLFYAFASTDRLTRPAAGDSLMLGGDNGLRGYPLRYQSGARRALVTLEERAYSDIYILQLFRVGGAVFIDIGRAWGGGIQNTIDSGWLSNAGFGLRIFNTRTASRNVLHVDVASPLNADANVKKLQFLVKVKASF
jgi:hypothetical protein